VVTDSLLVVDVNTAFGVSASSSTNLSLDTLLNELHLHGVAATLSHSMRRWVAGNSETLAVSKANRTILPVATINTKRHRGWQDEVKRCLQEGVVCFRFFCFDPDPEIAFEVSSASFQMILQELTASRVPIMLSAGGTETPTRIAEATSEYGLPVILTDLHYVGAAEAIAVMQRYDHIYVETRRLLAIPRAPELFVKEVGAERLLFGSGAPKHPAQPPLNSILQADISPEDKRRILGGNACRLFCLDENELLKRVLEASHARLAVPPGPIIDIHCHLDLANATYPIPDIEPAAFVEEMARYGVERSIVSSLSAIEYDIADGNRALSQAIQGQPSLAGMVVINPNHLDLSCQEMDRYYRQGNFVGAKLHSYCSGQPTGSSATRALVAEVARQGRPLLIHTDGTDLVTALTEMAHAHPGLAIIVAHGGYGGGGCLEGIWAAKEADNLYLEFSTSGPHRETIREAIDTVGPDRVLFGSDAGALDRGFVLGAYVDARLTPAESRMVMHDNAQRLFRL